MKANTQLDNLSIYLLKTHSYLSIYLSIYLSFLTGLHIFTSLPEVTDSTSMNWLGHVLTKQT